jgi:nitrite reductase (NO-forming)
LIYAGTTSSLALQPAKLFFMNAKRPSKVYPSKGGAAHPRLSTKKILLAVLLALALATALLVGLRSPGKEGSTNQNTAPQQRKLSLVLGDMFVEPRTISITQGDSLKLVVRNKGKVNHDLIFSNGQAIRQLKPGEEDTLDFGVPDGSLTAVCSLPGHAEAGMKFSIYVTDP